MGPLSSYLVCCAGVNVEEGLPLSIIPSGKPEPKSIVTVRFHFHLSIVCLMYCGSLWCFFANHTLLYFLVKTHQSFQYLAQSAAALFEVTQPSLPE